MTGPRVITLSDFAVVNNSSFRIVWTNRQSRRLVGPLSSLKFFIVTKNNISDHFKGAPKWRYVAFFVFLDNKNHLIPKAIKQQKEN